MPAGALRAHTDVIARPAPLYDVVGSIGRTSDYPGGDALAMLLKSVQVTRCAPRRGFVCLPLLLRTWPLTLNSPLESLVGKTEEGKGSARKLLHDKPHAFDSAVLGALSNQGTETRLARRCAWAHRKCSEWSRLSALDSSCTARH